VSNIGRGERSESQHLPHAKKSLLNHEKHESHEKKFNRKECKARKEKTGVIANE
jgi:hypothetical protein